MNFLYLGPSLGQDADKKRSKFSEVQEDSFSTRRGGGASHISRTREGERGTKGISKVKKRWLVDFEPHKKDGVNDSGGGGQKTSVVTKR